MEQDEEIEVEPFNWHEGDRDDFMHWAMISMVSDRRRSQKVLMAAQEASNDFRDLRVTLDINGVKLSALPFFERLWREMQHQAQKRAVELVEEHITSIRNASERVTDVLDTAGRDIREHFRTAGLPMNESEW
jgi:hypothetical protein